MRVYRIYHRYIYSKVKAGNSTELDLNLRNGTVRCSWEKTDISASITFKGKYNYRLPWMLPPKNANGPQRQNGEFQVDKSQQDYNVKILVKFTCHFCDHDWSTIESRMG